MRHFILITALATLILSCGQSDNKKKELELKEREIALKEKEFAFYAVVGMRRRNEAWLPTPGLSSSTIQQNIRASSNSMAGIITEYSHLFTATNLECKKLLQSDKLKNIVIDSMKYLVKEKGEISSYLECSKLINNLKIIGLQCLVPKAIGSI